MKRLRILIIPSELFIVPWQPTAAIFQADQAIALSQYANVEVTILSVGRIPFKRILKKNNYPLFDRMKGFSVYRHYIHSFFPTRWLPKTYLKAQFVRLGQKLFLRYIKEYGKPDIIHAHNVFYAGVLAKTISDEFNIPYVVTEHSSAYARLSINRKQKKWLRAVYAKANNFFAVSASFSKLLQNNYLPDGSECKVIPNVLGAELLGHTGKPIQSKRTDVFHFLNVAFTQPNKNQQLLLKAFAKKFKGNNKVCLNIIGSGSCLGNLKYEAKFLGIEQQVVFYGTLPHNKVIEQMQKSDCFVLSSQVETFGVVVIEAHAVGLPVISTRSGGPESIIDESNGILVPNNDSEAFAEAMQYVYNNAKRYSAEQIRNDCIRKYGPATFAYRMEAEYRTIVDTQS